uniref:Sodium-dependent phosphate transport protein 2B n=1 Tax=Panagrellus redivivus TaxID=6233 RepID=A0A7E4W6R3_PANRE
MMGSEMGASIMNALIKPIERLSALVVSPLSNLKPGQIKTLDALTDPILDKVIQIDDDGLNAAATSNATIERKTFVLRCINYENDINYPGTLFCPYEHIFAYSTWSDIGIGVCLLLVCVGSLVVCLLGIVKLMQDLLAGRIAVLLRKIMDKRLPYPFGWLTDYLVMLFGCAVVMVIQSSSVFRSALTPLVGVGVVTLDRLYPLIVGSNVGTTFTGVLAALSSDSTKLTETLQMALSQTFYNFFGLLLFYPIPFLRRIPMNLAMKLGDTTAKYRWFALVYILVVFILLPAFLLAISFLPLPAMISILGVVIIFCIFVVVVNVLQRKCAKCLPEVLKTWNFLPIWMHSLQPYDHFMTRHLSKLACCRKCFQQQPENDENSVSGFIGEISEPPVARLIRLSHQTQV